MEGGGGLNCNMVGVICPPDSNRVNVQIFSEGHRNLAHLPLICNLKQLVTNVKKRVEAGPNIGGLLRISELSAKIWEGDCSSKKS